MPSALMENVRGRYAPSGLYVLWPSASERFARHVALRWEKAAEAFLESMASLKDQARPEDLPGERATPKRRRKRGETSATAHAAASFGSLPAPGVTEQGPGSKAKTSSRPCAGRTESRSVESRAGQELSVPELRGACPEKSEPGEEAEHRGEGPVRGKRKVVARQSPGPATPVPSGLDDPEAGGPEAALAFTPGPLAAPKESLPGEWGVPIVR